MEAEEGKPIEGKESQKLKNMSEIHPLLLSGFPQKHQSNSYNKPKEQNQKHAGLVLVTSVSLRPYNLRIVEFIFSWCPSSPLIPTRPSVLFPGFS